MFRWIPESLAWLSLQGRREEVRAGLLRLARINGQAGQFDDVLTGIAGTCQDPLERPRERRNFLELCKYKRLRRFSLAIMIVW